MILTIINVLLTLASAYGAYKSLHYYNKSKVLTAHTNINKALVSVEEMLNKLPEALSAVNKNRQDNRGKNLNRIICEIGEELNRSYNEIHSCIPPDISEDFFGREIDGGFDLQKYINEFISGEALKEGTLDSDDYAVCQKCLKTMQVYLKAKLNEIDDKLK